MKKILIIFFLLAGCSNIQSKKQNNLSNIDFSKISSFNDYKKYLEEYANKNPYPNINY